MKASINLRQQELGLMDEVKDNFKYIIVEQEVEIDGDVHIQYGIKAINVLDDAEYYTIDNAFCEYDVALNFIDEISFELLEEEQIRLIIREYLS